MITHVHQCDEWKRSGTCEEHPCKCECGAVLTLRSGYKAIIWWWMLPDGTWHRWPDPRLDSLPESELLARHLIDR